jgi:hypothetical protein
VLRAWFARAPWECVWLWGRFAGGAGVVWWVLRVMHGKPFTPGDAHPSSIVRRRALERAILERARVQHWVLSAAQLLEIGLSREGIAVWLESGRLFRIHRGVYELGPSPLTNRGELMAAALACGPSSLISHRSAAALGGLARWPSGPPQVLLPSHLKRNHPRIAIHRTRSLPAADRARRDGIPVTSVPRTLIDLAGVVDAKALRRAVEEADRLGLLRLEALNNACATANGRRGIGELSPLEDRFLDFCREHGIPLPEMNVTLAGWRVDAHWPRARLVVELDSWEFHAGRGQFDRDRRKGLALQDAGYVLVRLSAPQLEGAAAAGTAAAISRKLAAA